MSRRGWVAAQTGPEDWHLLSVFDDGWVEVPGFARSLADTRANRRKALLVAGAVVGGIGLVWLVSWLLSRIEGLPLAVQVLPVLALLVLVVILNVWRARTALRNLRQVAGDQRQARRQKAAGFRITRTPGAPLFRRAKTAEEYAGWIEGETHVRATDVVEVAAVREDKMHVVTVRLSDGRSKVYRSPDGKLTELLCRLRPGVAPGC